MKKEDSAFSNSWDSKGLTKFEYMCIEFMKASIIADDKNINNRSTLTIQLHAEEAIRFARALCDQLEFKKGR